MESRIFFLTLGAFIVMDRENANTKKKQQIEKKHKFKIGNVISYMHKIKIQKK
jgi:hypothetical protein